MFFVISISLSNDYLKMNPSNELRRFTQLDLKQKRKIVKVMFMLSCSEQLLLHSFFCFLFLRFCTVILPTTFRNSKKNFFVYRIWSTMKVFQAFRISYMSLIIRSPFFARWIDSTWNFSVYNLLKNYISWNFFDVSSSCAAQYNIINDNNTVFSEEL